MNNLIKITASYVCPMRYGPVVDVFQYGKRDGKQLTRERLLEKLEGLTWLKPSKTNPAPEIRLHFEDGSIFTFNNGQLALDALIAMSKIEKGIKIFVFQPVTEVCKAHWVETSVTAVYEEDGEIVFQVDNDITLPGGSTGWGEWGMKDQGKAWDFTPGTLNFEEQTKLLMSVFD